MLFNSELANVGLYDSLHLQLLRQSASVRGFFLNHFASDYAPYIMKQISLYKEGKLRSFIDKGENSSKGPFIGLEKIVDAVEVSYECYVLQISKGLNNVSLQSKGELIFMQGRLLCPKHFCSPWEL